MKTILRSTFVLALLAGLSACNNNEDTTAPMIVHVHGPEEVAAGDDFEIEADFSDNEELGQAKIDIHDIFDGHDHGKVMVAWSETRVVQLSGKDAEIEETFTVDANATAGPYHAVVQCLDAEGNTAEFEEVDFWVTRADAAQFNVTSPADDSDMAVGDVISFVGDVMDDAGIEEVIVRVYEDHGDEEGHDHEDGEHDEYIYEEEVEANGATAWDLSLLTPITILADWIEEGEDHGDFVIEISAIDSNENISRIEIHIHVD